MRFLSFHCNYFNFKATKRSRSKLFEELNDSNSSGNLNNAVVLFISVEKHDSSNNTLLDDCIIEIEKIVKQLKVENR